MLVLDSEIEEELAYYGLKLFCPTTQSSSTNRFVQVEAIVGMEPFVNDTITFDAIEQVGDLIGYDFIGAAPAITKQGVLSPRHLFMTFRKR